MIKLIISDIDGTLVNSNKELPEQFWDVADLMRQKNIRFCAASGRQVQSLEKLFAPIAYEMGFVSDNGAFVKYKNEELFENTMDFSAIQPILSKAKLLKHIGVALCGKNKAYIKTDDTEIYDEIVLHYPAYEKVDGFENIDDEILKITICDLAGSKHNSYEVLKSFSSDFKVVVSGDNWLDITNLEVNKGRAIKMLQQKWNITPDETVVFGDQLNDIEMMKTATYSFAMKNAQEEVKKTANFITEYDNNNHGVIKTIAKLLKS